MMERTQKQTKNLTEGSPARLILEFAVPMFLGLLFQQFYSMVDTMIVGKFLGMKPLAGVGATGSLNFMVIGFCIGVCNGFAIPVAQKLGAKDYSALRRFVANATWLCLAFSVVMTVIVSILCGDILHFMKTPEDIFSYTYWYMLIIFLGIPCTFLYNILAALIRSLGDSKTPVIFLALASVMNAGLDVLLVAVFRWGVVGAGVATVMAEGISALLCAWHIYRRIPLLHLARRELKIDRRLLRETVSSGAITAMQQACQPIGKALIQSVMNAQGVSVIAAFNAVSRVDDFACIPEQSISSGMMTCIAQNRGAGEHARVGETLRRGMAIEAAYGVLICAAVLLAKEPVMRLFAAQDSVRMVSMGVDYLTLMAFFYILPGITNGIQGYFRGMGEMKTTLTATFIQISIRALVVAVLVPRIGLNGAAWACAVGWSAMLCYTFARYRRVRENE